jgi:hypothetical protein
MRGITLLKKVMSGGLSLVSLYRKGQNKPTTQVYQ